jgi:hypothetical protein
MEGSDEIVDPNTGIPLGELAEESRNSSPTLETRRNRKKRKAALLNTKVGVLVHSSTHHMLTSRGLEKEARWSGEIDGGGSRLGCDVPTNAMDAVQSISLSACLVCGV